jgi:hypothetical protein
MWFAVHAILSIRKKDEKSEPLFAYENIFLVEAPDSEAAEDKGVVLGKSQEGDAEGSLEWEGSPAYLQLEGIRKVVETRSMSQDNKPIGGAEVTYNLLEFQSSQALKAFAKGEVVSVTHCE